MARALAAVRISRAWLVLTPSGVTNVLDRLVTVTTIALRVKNLTAILSTVSVAPSSNNAPRSRTYSRRGLREMFGSRCLPSSRWRSLRQPPSDRFLA